MTRTGVSGWVFLLVRDYPGRTQTKGREMVLCVRAFTSLTLLVGWHGGHTAWKTEWWCAGEVICLERGADLHMAQLMPLLLTVSCFSRVQIGLPFWYRRNPVVPEKWPLNGCVRVLLVWRLFFEVSQSLLNHLCYMGTKLNLQIQHAGIPLTYKVI